MTKHRHACRLVPVLLAAALAGCDQLAPTPAAAPDAAARPDGLAPLLSAGADAVPGRYVVVLNGAAGGMNAASAVAQEVVSAHGGKVHYTYGRVLNGFAASLSPAAVAALQRNPQVRYVAEDGTVQTTQVTQPGATWGLDRVDQRDRPLNGTYVYGRTGAGVRVYVIDSGIRTSHGEFGGRASVGTDFVGDGQNGQDCRGHGTHVAGTIAGATYGVAKAAQLISVRVFGCTGGATSSTIIAAVEWVTANAQKPAVANMSLGGPLYAPINEAVQASIASGIVYSLSAGNNSTDACSQSPAATPEALTVGSTTADDFRSYFSNWGSCVDLFAPGSDITSAWYTGDSDTAILSGTSMAAPHVAGVAALYLQGAPTATPAAVAEQITASSTFGRLTDIVGSPNKLLFSRLTPEPAAPVISLSADSLAFTFVRPVAGAGSVDAGAPAQSFVSSGGTTPKMAPGDAQPDAVTATSTLSGRVLLTNTGTAPLNWTSTSDRPWLTLDPPSGRLTNGYAAVLSASASAATLGVGTHTGTLTLTDPAATNSPGRVSVTARVVEPTVLAVGTPVTGLSGDPGSQRHFAVNVPAGATSLRIATGDGSGDSDLYVRYGAVATPYEYDCGSWSGSTVDSCELIFPQAGTYYVMVRGFGYYAGMTLSATSGGVPAPPAGLVARPTTLTSIQLTWRDSAVNEAGYTLARRVLSTGAWGAWADLASPPANAVSFANTGLTAGGTYQYRLRACNAAGCSAWATTGAIVIPTVPPTAPFGLTAAPATGTSVRLTWTDGSTDETSFTLTRSLRNLDGTWPPLASVATLAPNAAGYTNTGLLAGRAYRWQLRACNAAGCSAWATSPIVTMPVIPATPGIPAGTVTSPTVIRVTWTDGGTGETSFTLARASVSSTGVVGTFATVATLAPNVVAFNNAGMTVGTYRYRIRACNLAGCSAWATGTDVVIPPVPAPPTGVTATILSPTQIRVTWTDAATTETSYQVYRSLRNLDGTWPPLGSVATLGANAVLFDNTGLLSGRSYRYTVRACNAGGCSAWGLSPIRVLP